MNHVLRRGIKMLRKLTMVLLSATICLMEITTGFAQKSTLKIYSTLQDYEKLTGEKIVKFQEAPMLKVKVAAGEIPPVEERLPEEPLVISPFEEIGQYGGTVHLFTTSATDPEDALYINNFRPLLSVALDCSTIIPNIAKKWEFSKDGKTVTLYLRKGIKWSDGVPFTADDVMFWWEDLMLNKEFTPAIWEGWCPGGEPMKVEKVDDYTIRLRFAIPYLIGERVLAKQTDPANFPKHYLKQFHIKYNPKANELAKENGFDSWYECLHSKSTVAFGSTPMNPDLPTIGPFKLTKRTAGYFLFERNPYFWKVDTKGNQLPYIDKILDRRVADVEMYNAKIVSGETDFAMDQTSLENYPLYKANAEKNNYRIHLFPGGWGSEVIFMFNQTCKDPVLRKIFQDVRFRRAMSLAINREEINEVVFFGLAVPRQMTVVPQSIYYEERFARAYADYDPDEANRLLDEMGLKWDENHKYRLRPDGKRLRFTLEFVGAGGVAGASTKIAVTELVKEYWERVGCQVDLKADSRELFNTRVPANEVEVSNWHGDLTTDMAFPLSPGWFIPYAPGGDKNIAPEWARWFASEGKEGEEPPDEVKKNYERWQKALRTPDKQESIKLFKEILESQAENLWTIGTVGMAPHVVIIKNNLRNVPPKCLYTWDFYYAMPCQGAQFFFRQK